jgi:hypothetical protein
MTGQPRPARPGGPPFRGFCPAALCAAFFVRRSCGGRDSLVVTARGQTPDPIPNSAVKTLSADGTASQDAEEQVAARLSRPPSPAPYPGPPPLGRPPGFHPTRSAGPLGARLALSPRRPQNQVPDPGAGPRHGRRRSPGRGPRALCPAPAPTTTPADHHDWRTTPTRHHRPTTAGWSSPVARQAHNLKVVGSNPTPATPPPSPQQVERQTPEAQPVSGVSLSDPCPKDLSANVRPRPPMTLSDAGGQSPPADDRSRSAGRDRMDWRPVPPDPVRRRGAADDRCNPRKGARRSPAPRHPWTCARSCNEIEHLRAANMTESEYARITRYGEALRAGPRCARLAWARRIGPIKRIWGWWCIDPTALCVSV